MCVCTCGPSNHVSGFRVHPTCSTSTCMCHKVALPVILRKYYNCPSSRPFPVSHPVFYGNHKNIAEARHPTAGKSERKEKNQRACELGWVCGDLCDSFRNSHFCTQLKDIKAMLNLSPVSDPLPPCTQIKVTQCPVINKHRTVSSAWLWPKSVDYFPWLFRWIDLTLKCRALRFSVSSLTVWLQHEHAYAHEFAPVWFDYNRLSLVSFVLLNKCEHAIWTMLRTK